MVASSAPCSGLRIEPQLHQVVGTEYRAVGKTVRRIDDDAMRVRAGRRDLRRGRFDPAGGVDRIDRNFASV